MKWEVAGVKDGKPGQWRLDASSEESARRKASAVGVVVSSVRASESLPAKITVPSAPAVVATHRAVHAEIIDVSHGPLAMQSLVCQNCGSPVGRLETPHVWQGSMVCAPCHVRLSGPVPAVQPAPQSPAGLTADQLAILTRAAAVPAPVTHVHVVNQNTSTASAVTVQRGCLGTIFRFIYLIVMTVVAVILFALAYGFWASTHHRPL